MPRPKLEVADIFRRHGAAWRAANEGHLSLAQRRVMTAIEICRTAALGGHVERCVDCAHTRIAYNSCLMGRSSNGELACRCWHFPVNCGAFCPHNIGSLRPRQLGH
jgi:Transposase zinc-binding domain